jgi:hypothetical protein
MASVGEPQGDWNPKMRLLADFDVDSDMCLVEGAAPLVVMGPDGTFSLTLSNAGRRISPH